MPEIYLVRSGERWLLSGRKVGVCHLEEARMVVVSPSRETGEADGAPKKAFDEATKKFDAAKNALTEAQGNMEQAVVILRKKGLAAAGKKAFITNRVGDAGFLLGMFVLIVSSLLGSINVIVTIMNAIKMSSSSSRFTNAVSTPPTPSSSSSRQTRCARKSATARSVTASRWASASSPCCIAMSPRRTTRPKCIHRSRRTTGSCCARDTKTSIRRSQT